MMTTTMTVKERMIKIETNIDNINEKLEDHVAEQREDFKNIMDKLDSMHNSYAGKWVEKVIIGIVIAIAGVIITTLI